MSDAFEVFVVVAVVPPRGAENTRIKHAVDRHRCAERGEPWSAVVGVVAQLGDGDPKSRVPFDRATQSVRRGFDVAGLDDDYFATIVTAFLATTHGPRDAQGLIGAAPSVLVDPAAITAFGLDWLETHPW